MGEGGVVELAVLEEALAAEASLRMGVICNLNDRNCYATTIMSGMLNRSGVLRAQLGRISIR
jgi:hypothetical protein